MDVDKQREIIRLWNDMRRVEGPVAEEIRIQILECFAQSPGARMSERQAVLGRVRVPTGQVHRLNDRGNSTTL
jgi:predicted transcriptional regulator